MRNFQDVFETFKRLFISAFSVSKAVPLTPYKQLFIIIIIIII